MKTILQHTFLSLLLSCWSTSYAFYNVPTDEQCYNIKICEGNSEYEERICETSMQMTGLPVLNNPADGDVDISLTPNLQWTGTGSAYTVEIYSCNPDPNYSAELQLNNFVVEIENKNVSNVSDDLSGATYNPNGGVNGEGVYLYVTNGGDDFGAERIIELDNNGDWIRAIKLNDQMSGTPDFDDTEGIVWIGGNDYLIIEERRKRVHRLSIDASTPNLIPYPSSYIQLDIDCDPNTPLEDCIEGITYNAFTNEVILVNEKLPEPEIYTFTLPATISGIVPITPTQPFNAVTKLGLNDLSGLHHFSLTEGLGNMNINDHFLVLSHDSYRLLEVDMDGNVYNTMFLYSGTSGLSATVSQAEGVTMDNEGNIYIASEPEHFYKFRNPTLDLNPFNLASNTTYSNPNVPGNSFTIPVGRLGGNTAYCWRVKDNATGGWSKYSSFTTQSVVCNSNYNALIALYQSTDGANWTNTWDLTQPVNTWYGVTLNGSGCVTQLELDNNNLNGSIPAELGDLTDLTSLDLGINNLSGNIPSTLGNLSNLNWLSLHNNNLTGGLPPSLANLTNLEYLIVANNQLTGCFVGLESLCAQLPSWANQHVSDGNYFNVPWESFCATGNCTQNPCVTIDRDALIAFYNSVQGLPWDLSQPTNTWDGVTMDVNGCVSMLQLKESLLTGTIPPEIGDLSNLTILDLFYNQLSGDIPEEIGNLDNLEYLFLDDNQLTGNIPSTIGNLSGLIGLSLSNNQLSGCYDNNLLNLCGQLSSGGISYGNNFDVPWEYFCNTGSCTPSACSMSDRDALIAFYNTITDWGTMTPWDITEPMDTWQGVALNGDGCVTRLELGWDGLVGSIPSDFGNLENLTYLFLAGNTFSGGIPSTLGNLTNLTQLHLRENELDGSIPPQLSNLINLEVLVLRNNDLNGNIPSGLGDLTGLTELNFIDNQLSGSIPSQLGNLNNLTRLDLGYNQLSGSVPSELGDLSNLIDLDLRENQLDGSVPPQLGDLSNLENFTLYANNFTGSIPPELGNMTSVKQLSLSDNQLTGSIPEELCNLVYLTGIYLSNNNLNGNIPACILNMANAYLDNNNFGGNLPAVAGAVGNLRLQNNQLTGCYDPSLASMCGQENANGNISDGNNFNASWEDFCNTGAGSCGACTTTDYNALVAFHNAITDWGTVTAWDLTQPMSTWEGITLNADGCVTSLDLYEKSIIGTLVPELGDLTNLTYLSLGGNQLSGSIPTEIGNLTNLTILNLEENLLTGNLPTEIGNLTNLTNLLLENNQLSGSIPAEIGNLTNLTYIWIQDNQFSGSIPAEIGNLTNLTYLLLDGNQLSGSIPAEIANLTNLTALYLYDNQLGGCYDENLMGLCTQLNLSTNVLISDGNNFDTPWEDFCNSGAGTCIVNAGCRYTDSLALVAFYDAITAWTGAPPWDLAQPINTWQGIYLNANDCVNIIDFEDVGISGTIPPELGDLSSLTALDLGVNDFTGDIPPELGNLSNLTYLNLDNNGLTGSIPAELGDLSNLNSLGLSNNGLTGSIPAELGNLSNLGSLGLVSNGLTGSIPAELGNLNYLNSLGLSNNGLTGSIPIEIGNLTNLTYLGLSNNQLSGSIFAEIGNLTNLTYLSLENNQLSGSIPVEIGNLTNLTYLLSLQNNQLSGSIPVEIGNLTNLPVLRLQNNQLSGSIPAQMGNLTNLAELELYNNQLEGCYDENLMGLCTQLYSYYSSNQSISDGNNFDVPWEDFCNNGTGNCIVNTSCSYTDSLALVALYNATDGANWTTPWDLTQPMSTWANVVLNASGCVTSLYLSNEGLNGAIPPELGTLNSLEYIDFGLNNLTGNIPLELVNISTLQSLKLSYNQLSGVIPVGLGNLANLTDLRLDANQLSGTIPSELSNLSNLTQLYLRYNQLSGNIPPELGNLTNLQRIYFGNNQLTGSIPSSFGNLTNLTVLVTSNNQLSGCYNNSLLSVCGQLYSVTNASVSDGNNFDAPWEDFCNTGAGTCEDCTITNYNALVAFYNAITDWGNAIPWDLTQPMNTWEGITVNADGCVISIDLYEKYIIGTLVPELGDLTNLTSLSLGDNQLSGNIPTEIGNLTNLIVLGLEENQLTGSIPTEIGNLTNLVYLNLEENQLSGNIPTEIGNLANLTSLNLGENQLSGSISAQIGNLTNLAELRLENNQLSGSIPTEIENLTSLTYLHLRNNQLSGNILAEIGNLTNLTHLFLDGNQLSGNIPTEIGSLANLTHLFLDGNQLSGSIPVEIGNLNLTGLKLDNNQLSGCYDENLMNLCTQLSFSYNTNQSISDGNNFDAPWEDFCNNGTGACIVNTTCRYTDSLALVALYNATDGDNWAETWDLTQPIDTWIGVGLDDNGCVEILFPTGNDLVGQLPPEIGDFSNIKYIILDQNTQISGGIPPEIANLQSLEALSLFNVWIGGTIPLELGNLKNLKSLNLRSAQLTGSIPAELANADSLYGIDLRFNQLVGDIPSELSGLNNLTSLRLNDNQLEGGLPGSFSNMTNLTTLSTFNNQLSGCYDNSLLSLCGQLPSYSSTNVSISNGNNFDADWEDFCTNGAGSCMVNTSCSYTDSLALVALYDATDGANWATPWDLTQPMNSWANVVLNSTGCVTALPLYNQGMDGPIPPELGTLNSLEYMHFWNNNLTGAIPPELGNMASLINCALYKNNLSGTIPSELGNINTLQSLRLSENQLEGAIPIELGNLSNLTDLRLDYNQLSGFIPSEISNLNNLTRLYLNDNQLAGNLLVGLGNLTSLQRLYLNNNQFEGGLPSSFSNMTSLTTLSTYNNQLSGCYDNSLLSLCGQLPSYSSTNVSISNGNNFDATWEDFCNTNAGNCTLIPTIGAGCQIRDSLALAALYHATDGDNWAYSWDMEQPTSTWNGVSMNEDGCVTYLNLSANYLNGTLPPDLGNLSELTGLSLHNNQLNGNIPSELGYLLKLEEIYLYSNHLTGSIPAELGDLVDLRSLWLSNNQLTDSIPATLGNLANLTSLYLNNNQLGGNIPPTLGDLISVRTMWLANNQLSGSIPAAFGDLPNLSNLGLHSNQLTGCYPISLVNICAYTDNGDLSDGNSFDMPWEDFCSTGAAACENCPADLNLSNPLITRTYQAGTTISSESTAPAGTDVQFKAGDVILLDKGFSIEPGSSFSGEIEDCN